MNSDKIEKKKTILTIASEDSETKEEVKKTLEAYEALGKTKGLTAQIGLGANYIASDIQKTKALNVMAFSMKEMGVEMHEMEIELKAYENALGRKLTQQEHDDFKNRFKKPSLFEDIDEKLLERCNRNLNASKQITKK